MVDIVENGVQLVALTICFALAVAKAVRGRDRMWVILSFFYGCSFFSLLYWTSYLVAFGHTPRYSYSSDLGWMASLIFLVILLVEFDVKWKVAAPVRIAWAVPIVCVPACILYCTHGEILLNVVDCFLIAVIGYFATRGAVVSAGSGASRRRALHLSILAFALAELVLWMTSCFWTSQMPVPYIVADYALTATYAAILAYAWKLSLE